jgi:hypothetical protein
MKRWKVLEGRECFVLMIMGTSWCYSSYDIQRHLRNSVTGPILRCMLGYTKILLQCHLVTLGVHVPLFKI